VHPPSLILTDLVVLLSKFNSISSNFVVISSKMSNSDLVWGMKNGDLDTVKEFVEKNVSFDRNPAHPADTPFTVAPFSR
jgi:hypothetical protein